MRLKTLIAGVVATIACAAQAQNLLLNNSFEIPGSGFALIQDWGDFGNISIDNNIEVVAQDGVVSAKMFGASNGVQSDQGLFQNVLVTEGLQYTLSAYTMDRSADPLGAENIILIQMVFRNSIGDILQTDEINAIDPLTDPLDTWVSSTLVSTAPTGATSVDVFLLHIQLGLDQGPVVQDGGSSFWDNISLIESPAACTNPADINGDGILDFFDVSAFLQAFSQGCP